MTRNDNPELRPAPPTWPSLRYVSDAFWVYIWVAVIVGALLVATAIAYPWAVGTFVAGMVIGALCVRPALRIWSRIRDRGFMGFPHHA